jgi:hypothetical protein
MQVDYSAWRILVSKKAGSESSHFGERGEQRGLIRNGHSPSIAQIRSALSSRNAVFLEARNGCVKAVFRARNTLGKMAYWTLIFKPDQRRRSVYVITVHESSREEAGAHKYQKGI